MVFLSPFPINIIYARPNLGWNNFQALGLKTVWLGLEWRCLEFQQEITMIWAGLVPDSRQLFYIPAIGFNISLLLTRVWHCVPLCPQMKPIFYVSICLLTFPFPLAIPGMFSFYSQPKSHGASTIVDFIEKAMEHSLNGKFLYFLRPRAPGLPPASIQLLYPISRLRNMHSLQHQCRFAIVKCVRRDLIDRLPIPPRLKVYLKQTQYYVEGLEDSDSAHQYFSQVWWCSIEQLEISFVKTCFSFYFICPSSEFFNLNAAVYIMWGAWKFELIRG